MTTDGRVKGATTNAGLRARQTAAVAQGIATKAIFAERARNAELWDVEGRRYVDFAAGIAVTNTGHRHPAVMAAVARQAEAFTHTCFHVAPYEGYVRLAERLNAAVETGGENRTMLATTGAEAVENAVKIARAYTGRSGVIAFSGAFHGRTMMGMAMTGKVRPYKAGFGPFPAEVHHAPFPNPYTGPGTEEALTELERLLATSIDAARIASIVVEPVQGEGGFNVAPAEFLQALRRIADEHGIVLVADEVQGGMARTGRLLSIEHAGVRPDIVTLAKGLAGGFPLSAVVGRAEIMNAAPVGGLGGTYAGNPLGVAAANAVLDVIEDEGLCERALAIGRTVRGRLDRLAEKPEGRVIGHVRGLGAMIAFELVTDRETKDADVESTARLVGEAQSRGLILLSCGTRANVIRLLPPLTIEEDVLDEGLSILEASLAAIAAPARAAA